MAYLSICSGIESATVAWHPLGWTPVAFAEIEPFPCARVFVVGHSGDWRRAAAVLFERESLSGNHPPRRETRQRIAPTVEARANAGGAGWGTDFLVDGGMVDYVPDIVPQAVSSKWHKHSSGPAGDEVANLIATAVADPVCANEQRTYTHEGEHNFRLRNVVARQDSAFDLRGREGGVQFQGPHDTASIRAASGGSSKSYVANWAVRRLTPRECERLQGFPDDYTLIRWRGKPAADGPRYKALGNAMAVNCMRWLGRRIDHVSAIAGC